MSKTSSGKAWPIAIGLAITAVFGMGVATIIVTGKADVQKSDAYMTYYQEADANVNKYIKKRIAFDKSYNISYINNGVHEGANNSIRFKVTTKAGKVVKNAKLIISVSRPETEQFNKKYDKPVFENGVYTFKNVAFLKAGIWNIITKVEVDGKSRFLNFKVDTRNKKIKYFD